MFYMYDSLYFLFLLPGLLLSGLAAYLTKTTFARYARLTTQASLTGADVARAILRDNGISNVQVEAVAGHLTDHYDPTHKVLRLSHDVYHGRSLSAFGVAAHEVGHALQDKVGYLPLKLRSGIVPIANFGSPIGMLLIFAAMSLGGVGSAGGAGLAWAGLGLFSLGLIFSIVTLPVEFDASMRALRCLKKGGYLVGPELQGATRVLNAAALTYVAAAISQLLVVLYYAYRLGLFDRRDD